MAHTTLKSHRNDVVSCTGMQICFITENLIVNCVFFKLSQPLGIRSGLPFSRTRRVHRKCFLSLVLGSNCIWVLRIIWAAAISVILGTIIVFEHNKRLLQFISCQYKLLRLHTPHTERGRVERLDFNNDYTNRKSTTWFNCTNDKLYQNVHIVSPSCESVHTLMFCVFWTLAVAFVSDVVILLL